jgi:hypothetical protein
VTTYNLYRILKEELKNGSADLVTRQSGQVIRARIEKDIENEKSGEIIALDFAKIGIIDYSCADEIVAKLISRLLSGTRLLNLHKKRLVKRTDEIRNGGRVWIYEHFSF